MIFCYLLQDRGFREALERKGIDVEEMENELD